MNNTEAKFILNAYRPSGQDATDAKFGAALDQAKSDPALGAWFAREQAHGAAVAAKLREVAPPAGLREAILAGGRMSGGESATQRDRPVRWTQPVWLAAAAAVALLLTVSAVVWSVRSRGSDAPLTRFALADALETESHGGHGAATDALQASLADGSTRLASALPINFAALRSNGCRTMNVAGHDVLEVCFKRDGKWFHCYIARVEDFPGSTSRTAPNFAEQGRVAAAAWSDGVHRIVVASEAGSAAVRRLL